MADNSGIEWTDATWNPVTGCTKVSSGCDNCYAETLSRRLLSNVYRSRAPVIDSEVTHRDPFAVRLWPERLEQPLNWRDRRTVFVNSMSDVFHIDIPDEFLRDMFAVMHSASWHTYQILTKRPGRAFRFFQKNQDVFEQNGFPDHIWLGTSVEDQRATYRVRQLRQIPAAVRFLSCEPLLGPLSLELSGIHWVIVGGESGLTRRPMRKDWAVEIRDQCRKKKVPFFFKQWGGRTPKANGRVLDGRHWDELPQIAAQSR